MLKVLLALLTAAAILAVGFIALPKLLLHAPGASTDNNVNVPVGRALGGAVTASAGGSPAPRTIEDFASIQNGAGFPVLTPASLPAGYQPWEQFLRRGGDTNSVVLTYRKDNNLYLVIDERKHDNSSFFVPQAGFTPRAGFTGPGGAPDRQGNGRPVQRAVVDVAGTPAFYTQGITGQIYRVLGGSGTDLTRLNGQPHELLFTRGGVDVVVEADQTDIPRDQLIQIAAALR